MEMIFKNVWEPCFLLAWGVYEFTQKLSLDSSYCLSFRVVILIAFHS